MHVGTSQITGHVDDGVGDNGSDLVRQAALLILGLKEKYKLTQVATQGIIDGVTGLVQVSAQPMPM